MVENHRMVRYIRDHIQETYLARRACGTLPSSALIRPISARSSVVEQRVTQDFTPSFCRVDEGTARDFCENLTTNCGSAPRRGCRRLSIYDSSNERRNEGLSIAPDPLRQQRDLNKDWPVFLRLHSMSATPTTVEVASDHLPFAFTPRVKTPNFRIVYDPSGCVANAAIRV